MSTTNRARIAGAASALLVSAPLLSGCGGKDAAADPPAASGTSSSSDPSSQSGTAAPAASGPLVVTKWFTLHVPAGWHVRVLAKNFSIRVEAPGASTASINFGMSDTYGYPYSLRQLAKIKQRNTFGSPPPEIVSDTEVAGEPAYHLTGPTGRGINVDIFGIDYDDHHITFDFELKGSADERRAIVDSVLATIELK